MGEHQKEMMQMIKNRFQFKLYITYSVILSLILALAMFVFFSYNSTLLQENLEELVKEVSSMTCTRMEELLNDMDQQLKQLHASADFMNLAKELSDHDYEEDYFSRNAIKASEFRNNFTSILVTRSFGSSIAYISSQYNNMHVSISSQKQYSVANEELESLGIFQKAVESDAYQIYLPPHNSYWEEDKQVISVLRPVSDMFYTYGVLEYDCSVEEFNKIVEVSEEGRMYDLYLFDQNGSFLYTTDRENIGMNKIKDVLSEMGEDKTIISGNEIFTGKQSELTGWSVIISRDISDYQQEQKSLLSLICLIFLGGCLLLLFVLYYVTSKLMYPIQELRSNLLKHRGDEEIQLEIPESSDEIVMLGTTIEMMFNRMYRQNQLLLQTRERAQKAHMDAMEAQLNPHFLYNTLSIIGAYGMESGNRTVMQMCTELAQLLRYSITYTSEQVPLSYEMDNLRHYLYIMKMRHEHMLECSWELEDALDDVKVPKLILQPIVENCFQHGFKGVPPIWKIHIRSWKDDSYWHVAVSNNGHIFEEKQKVQLQERIKKIQESFHGEGDWNIGERQGYGLENTVIRLNLYYQGDERFRIISKDDWTTVEIGGKIKL